MLPKLSLLTFLQTICLLIVSINCEKASSFVEYSGSVFVKDVVHHEGNMNTEMEDEVVAKAVELSTKSNNSIVSSMAKDLKNHLTETFNGTWFVIIGYGEVSSSWEKTQGDNFLRFSYKKIMFIVTQSKSVEKGCPSPAQLLKEAANKAVVKTDGRKMPDAEVIAGIKLSLSSGKIATFQDLAVKLWEFFSKNKTGWDVNVGLTEYFGNFGDDRSYGWYDVNGIRIHIHKL